MPEYTVELEARPKGDTFNEAKVGTLLTLLEGGGTFLGPVLSVGADGGVKVLGQIEAYKASAALSIGRVIYGTKFETVFGDYEWTTLAVTEFKPDQPVESIPTPV